MRPFTEDERIELRKKIVDKGREMFGTFGIKKTSIHDLTRDAGIAKSSFYLFFPSKEDLYREIFIDEGHKVIKHMVNESFIKYKDDPHKAIIDFIKITMDLLENNPIFNRMMNKEDRIIMENILKGHEMHKRDASMSFLRPFMENWQSRNLIIPDDPTVIAGAVRAIIFLIYHKKEIGEDYFDRVIYMISDLVAKGLVVKKEDSND